MPIGNKLFLGARVLLNKNVIESRLDDIAEFLDDNGDIDDEPRFDDYVRLFMSLYLNQNEVKCYIISRITDDSFKVLLTADKWHYIGTFTAKEIKGIRL